jgi:hypothetical protein
MMRHHSKITHGHKYEKMEKNRKKGENGKATSLTEIWEKIGKKKHEKYHT